MKIAIVSGKDEGPTKLNAFDNALLAAGIGDVNLIKVSSMLEGNTEIQDIVPLKPGSMVKCVLSSITSDNPGDEITAVVAVAIGENLGCVVEETGTNENPAKLKDKAIFMVKYMMEIRNETIKEIVVKEITHKVEKIGSAIASVVYLNDEIVG